jgi:phosphoglycolate phosphatase
MSETATVVVRTEGPWTPVLFDMDGTLLDSAPAIVKRLTDTLVEFGIPAPPIEEVRLLIGPPTGTSLARYIAPEHMDAARAYYRSLAERDGLNHQRLFDGITDTLEALTAHGLPLAVATSKPQPEAERVVEAFGITRYFHSVVGANEERLTKADVVAAALRQLAEASPRLNPVMVGDRFYDTEGAAAHGVPTVLVRWGYAAEHEFDQAMASVSTPQELVTLLGVPQA